MTRMGGRQACVKMTGVRSGRQGGAMLAGALLQPQAEALRPPQEVRVQLFLAVTAAPLDPGSAMSPPLHADIPDFATVRRAIAALTPGDEACWGSMNASSMVEHLVRLNEIYLGRRPVAWWVALLARLIRGPVIRHILATSPFETKRGMTTLATLRVAGDSVDVSAFDAVRDRFLSTLDEIEAKQGRWAHPLFGSIDSALPQALVRYHAAHHLRQFGRL